MTKNCCTSRAVRSSNRQELRIECWKVKFRHFRNELFWQELDIVLEGLDARHFPQQIKLRQNLDREGTRHLEGQMASVATQIQKPQSA